LEALGMSAPLDCSIVGFDNQDTIAPYLSPGLTTVELPFERMARTAVQLLLDKRGSGPNQFPIECSLIPRESVASAKVPA
ncbi:MAG: substrate-binding domain-containing protein, partial [Actinomycetes bacterium]